MDPEALKAMGVLEALEGSAQAALEGGDFERALQIYQELELKHQHEPRWSKQVAALHRRLGNHQACINILDTVAERYVARREPLKAIAASKMLLAVDPEHAPTQARLRRLLGLPKAPNEGPPPRAPSDLPTMRVQEKDLALLPLIRSQPTRIASAYGAHSELGQTERAEQIVPISRPQSASLPPSALGSIPLLSVLEQDDLQWLLPRTRLFEVRANEPIFRQGDPGDSLMIIVEGRVRVVLEESERVPLAELGDGEFFGEVALFTERPRGATVEAMVPTELFAISRDTVLGLVRRKPRVLNTLLDFFRERMVDTVFKSSPLFANVSPEDRMLVRAVFELVDICETAIVIEEGSVASGLFVLVDGQLEVRKRVQDAEVIVARLGPGHICGEISALTHLRAVATVRALEPSLALHLPTNELQGAVLTHPELLRYATEIAQERMGALEVLMKAYDDNRARLV